ncbi:hypothetical protein [Escherichia sp. E1130]|uniref:hypothetical protein n=1 Tax=Escherichia sp. E1130 TaxID=2041645 RepID=UPI0010817F4D|nr:hypothetical protein [Escherichia sp. E1130]TGC28014.1 hypothetical protein CQJ27_03770 [Escherichia sp. E1130]TLI70090.1 hypothetical protein FEK66_15815 [Escherichia sp. E1130]
MKNRESNVSSLQELADFNVSYSLLTNEVYLSASFIDNMACIPHWPVKEFPDQFMCDQFMCISRTRAKELINELQKAINYMDAGIDNSHGR